MLVNQNYCTSLCCIASMARNNCYCLHKYLWSTCWWKFLKTSVNPTLAYTWLSYRADWNKVGNNKVNIDDKLGDHFLIMTDRKEHELCCLILLKFACISILSFNLFCETYYIMFYLLYLSSSCILWLVEGYSVSARLLTVFSCQHIARIQLSGYLFRHTPYMTVKSDIARVAVSLWGFYLWRYCKV